MSGIHRLGSKRLYLGRVFGGAGGGAFSVSGRASEGLPLTVLRAGRPSGAFRCSRPVHHEGGKEKLARSGGSYAKKSSVI